MGAVPPSGSQALRVYTLLREALVAGEFPSGTRLPSQESLARRFGVATLTLRRALSVLEGEGFVISHHGRGTFVLAQTSQVPVSETDVIASIDPYFHMQFQNFPVPTFTWRAAADDWVLVDANRAADALTHGAIRPFIGQRGRVILAAHPEVLATFDRCRARRQPMRQAMSWRLVSTGEERDLIVSYIFVPPDLVMVHAEDETERKTAERALRDSEERLRSLVAACGDGIFRIEEDGTITFANQRAADLHGYLHPSELVGLPGADLVSPEYRGQARRNIGKAMEAGQVTAIEYPALRKDGSTFPAEVSASAIHAAGQPAALTVIVRDVSERKIVEDRMLQDGPRLNALLEERVAARTAEIRDLQEVTAALSGAVSPTEVADVMVSRVLPLMEANGGSIHMLADKGEYLDYLGGSGYGPDVTPSFQRIPLSISSPFTDAVRERTALWIESPEEWRTRYPEDAMAPCEDQHEAAAIIPLVAKGKALGVLGVTFAHARQFDDDARRFMVSVAQQCAQALERARLYDAEHGRVAELQALNHELETFAYSVSHDLRSPLRGIDGFSKLVVERYADRLDDTGKQYLHRVRAATQRMSLLIDDLLKLSRVTRAELHCEQIDLSELARDVLADLVVSEPHRQVNSLIQPGLAARADPRLVRVVLENLLDNAWKFTSTRDAASIEVGVQEHDGQQVYFVRDNGVGYDMAYADKLFGPFQRLHSMHEFGGTGIGLATVQRIVNRHDGQTWAEAAVNQGATVYFTLGGT